MTTKLTLPAILVGALLATIFFFELGGPRGNPEIDRTQIVALATAFAEGKQERNGLKACQQLTEGQQREVVARVDQVSMANANPERCPQVILSRGQESAFTQPGVESFLEGIAVVTFGGAPAFDASVRSADGRASLEAWRRIGEWRLDGLASEGVDFVRACQGSVAGNSSSCQCIFDVTRATNPGEPSDFLQILDNALVGNETAQFTLAKERCRR